MKVINHNLTDRKWEVTENILKVALKRKVSTQLVRAEIISKAKISPALLSLLEKTEKGDTKNTMTIAVEDKLNAYFTEHLKEDVILNGNLVMALQAA